MAGNKQGGNLMTNYYGIITKENSLSHYNVKGTHWGDWNDETIARYLGLNGRKKKPHDYSKDDQKEDQEDGNAIQDVIDSTKSVGKSLRWGDWTAGPLDRPKWGDRTKEIVNSVKNAIKDAQADFYNDDTPHRQGQQWGSMTEKDVINAVKDFTRTSLSSIERKVYNTATRYIDKILGRSGVKLIDIPPTPDYIKKAMQNDYDGNNIKRK